MKLKCKEHPTYKGVREPTADCAACWLVYEPNKSNDKYIELELADASILIIESL